MKENNYKIKELTPTQNFQALNYLGYQKNKNKNLNENHYNYRGKKFL